MKRLIIGGALLAVAFAGAAQNLPLPDAINIALKNSLDIQLAKNRIESNAVLNNYGVAGGLPVVTGNLTDNEQLNRINLEYSDPTQNTQRNNTASSFST